MGHTLVEKIIGNKVGHEVKPGDIVTVDVDWCMIDDIMVPFAVQKFEEMGFSKVAKPKSVVLPRFYLCLFLFNPKTFYL